MTKHKTTINPYIIITLLTVLLFVIQFLISRFGWLIAGLFDVSAIDPDGLFAGVSVHHIVTLFCSLALIALLSGIKGIRGFKLRPKYDSKGVKYTAVFCTAVLVYYIVTYLIEIHSHSVNTYDIAFNTRNVIGTLGFQLLLTGPSEEVCFRALPITLLLFYLNPDSKKDRIIAVVISAFLFGLGHIGVMTFSIPWFQVCYAFVFGLAFGFVQLKTNSIIYPMIMHSVSNLISVGSSYLYMYISGKS
ncbi:MAG: CPBP family intramembrane metalloprotease [Oscillospiraceae bacterium]|nr:CPBP family intramembrane metalloprotease [Oscillospiraceae bacterium]